MTKTLFKLIALPIIGLTLGTFGELAHSFSVSASYFKTEKIYNTTPQTLRGNWYSYVNGHMCVTHINKFSVTQTYKGKTHGLFRSNWKGYKKLAVAKIVNSEKYTFNALADKAYQSDGGWKTTYRTINKQKVKVLRDYHGSGGYVDLFRAPIYKSYAK
ncbi:hypothetical protein [Lentilactobacillus hilgardii]|uniref:Uncharacterized protein n=1 Tax=Lentilactobacillus hilgardii (strain ATCC 8290 / DSM 20176 / CCUG 30140 / JCM 1155 / KCTC 3500 / NBRC 15886 / NCIMB 8040 / NRRL B-1843 / 9) TaxID=1423757 RepID=C0XKZ6_LENH9|nr:hypothetical protein [Lentilactobacillus hilgardii]EEI23741.1 hypothetical protein HMPREF0519_1907 [Lentilactobacillus hilgardii DSM 20176 = ATCC 8290]KRK59241.1 hypothetical protein FD42_GL000937 [Lentilactobacillus hilgardii DSM 20176 = ATCC 8290]QEU38305.1 hypothetical protein LH500_05070 [Lentilactobacillus hilgardii]TDG86087.1 hypothetical protein C5L34_002248 [Lentilactobacillus hilgardii]